MYKHLLDGDGEALPSFFDPSLTSNSLSLGQLEERLWDEFCRGYRPSRKSSPEFLWAMRHCQGLLLLNFAAVYASRLDGGSIRYYGGKGWYAENRHWLGTSISANAIGHAVTFLIQAGYVQHRSGRSSASQSFREPASLIATTKLVSLIHEARVGVSVIFPDPSHFSLRLRAAKVDRSPGKYVSYVETTETKRMKSSLEVINQNLLGHWPDIQITRNETKHLEGLGRGINLTKRTLHRTFNNGSFEQGGRFYGAWWINCPEVFRPYITINGRRTVEVDYSAIHPTIVYHEMGIPIPPDPYDIGLDGGKALRNVVKRTFNALLNARSLKIEPVDGFVQLGLVMGWNRFLELVLDHYDLFRPVFGKGMGLKLQRIDSDVAELVLLHFAHKNKAILPVHDSFIVEETLEVELIGVMQSAFRDVTGANAGLQVERIDPELLAMVYGRIRRKKKILMAKGFDRDRAMAPFTGEYADYNKRHFEWFEERKYKRSSQLTAPIYGPPN